NYTPTPHPHTLSLHDALPICTAEDSDARLSLSDRPASTCCTQRAAAVSVSDRATLACMPRHSVIQLTSPAQTPKQVASDPRHAAAQAIATYRGPWPCQCLPRSVRESRQAEPARPHRQALAPARP